MHDGRPSDRIQSILSDFPLYRCDVKRVTTINYDRNLVRKELGKLNKASDEISAKLDLCLVTSSVDYVLPFDVNDSFADAFEAFMAENNTGV